MSFQLALPGISLHGYGAISDLAQLLAQKNWGKALIVTDDQLAELGLTQSLTDSLQQHTIPYALFTGVAPNPTEEQVQAGLVAFRQQQCDFLIAFGGGSPIDTAKAIKILTANPGRAVDYAGVGKVRHPGVPLVAITNGNAQPELFGLGDYFEFVLRAGPDGRSKPFSDMYTLAAEKRSTRSCRSRAQRASARCCW